MTLIVEAEAPPLSADETGVMRIGRTRVTLDTVVHVFNEGSTAEEIVSRYPALQLSDVYAVISYYLKHQDAVHVYLEEQATAVAETWTEIELKPDYQRFRDRFAARQSNT